MKKILALFLVMLLVVGSTMMAFADGSASVIPCEVTTNKVNERVGPGKGFKSVCQHSAGEIVDVVDATGVWWRLANGHYMMAEFLRQVSADYAGGGSTSIPCRVTTKNVNERVGPGKQFKSVGWRQAGDIVNVVDATGTWWKLANGHYIMAKYLKIVSSSDEPPITDEPLPPPPGGDMSQAIACRVTADQVNERTGPGKGYKSVCKHDHGEIVYVINASGTWWKLANGHYMMAEFLKKVSDPDVPTNPGGNDLAQPILCRVTANGVNERLGPSKSYESVRKHDRGEVLSIINTTGSWWKLTNGHYMMAEFLQMVSSSDVPPAPAPSDDVSTAIPCMVTADRVNERLGPSKGYDSVRKHDYGEIVYVTSTYGTWWKLTNGHYMMAEFLSPMCE